MSKPEYLSRDLSFLSFNRRVLDEAKKDIPLADRVMFFGIAGGSNLDEFLNVRYPACLAFQSDEENEKLMDGIKKFYLDAVTRFETFNKKHKIVRSVKSLDKDDRKWADKYFKQNVYPALQTITFERGRTLNLHSGFYVLVLYEHHDDEMAGYIEIPKGINRFIQIPGKKFVIGVEDLIKANIKMMFLNSHEYTVAPFVISRSAEVFVQTDQYTDPLKFIQNTLREREQSWITYLEVGSENKRVLKILRKCLPLSANTITLISPYVHLMDLKKIPKGVFDITEQARKYEPIVTFPQENLFGYIRKEDRLCFHPYESYQASMVKFLEEASNDPDVVSIKIALYRVSDNSKIIDALLRAADKGKLVTVLVELKARFDEHHNIEISNLLKEGGVRIVFTKPDIKAHAKVCLVTRKDHPALHETWNLDTFLRYPHISICWEQSDTWALDNVLQELRRERTIAMSLPEFEQSLFMAAQPDNLLLATAPRYCQYYNQLHQLPLVALPLPFDESQQKKLEVPFTLLWHKRNSHNPKIVWLRETIKNLYASMA